MFVTPARTGRLVMIGVVAGMLVGVLGSPGHASAHWGVCLNDPIVWLGNGTLIDMSTAIQADPTAVTHITYTLHVPAGALGTRAVYTAGAGPSFETIVVVPDSNSGYVADAYATSVAGTSFPMALTVHAVNQSSQWSSATGSTDQNVTARISTP